MSHASFNSPLTFPPPSLISSIQQSPDGKRVYVCSGDAVRCFSTATGAPVGSPLVGHTADVTSVGFHPAHPGGQVVLTTSLDGTIRLWNAGDGSAGQVLTAPGPVESMVVPAGRCQHGRDVVFLSCWQRRKEASTDGDTNERSAEGGRVHCFSLGKAKSIDKLLKTQVPPPLVSSPNGTFLGTHDRHTVIVWPLTQRDTGTSLSTKALRLHHTKQITCVAFDQNDKSVAAGDSTGRILQWHGFAQAIEKGATSDVTDDTNVPCTTFHWHAQSVGCLRFTEDGSYLLSGGKESVLVLWQLDGGKKSYLPRLGGALVGITRFPNDASKIAIAQSDNAVRVISLASLTVECVARGVRPDVLSSRYPSFAEDTTNAILDGNILRTQPLPSVSYDPFSKTIALASNGASLQLFCPFKDQHLLDLEVAPLNQVSGDGGVDDPMEPYVSHASFSKDGSILVTVDRRFERAMPKITGDSSSLTSAPEETLRIWTRKVRSDDELGDDTQGTINNPDTFGFTCVCVCDAPHAGAVTSVSVRGSTSDGSAMACTTSTSGDAKMWVPSTSARSGERAGWRCRSAVSHAGYPSPGLTRCAFSQDGSLLATAGETVTVWEPESCTRLHSFALQSFGGAGNDDKDGKDSSASQNVVNGLAFIAGTPLLAASSPSGVVVWNLASLVVWRAVAMPCVGLTAHATLAKFAVSVQAPEHKGSLVFRFEGEGCEVTGCFLAPGGAPQALIYPLESNGGLLVVTHDRRIAQCGDVYSAVPDVNDVETHANRGSVSITGTSLKPIGGLDAHAQRLQGDTGGLNSAIGANAKAGGNNPWGTLFDAPSHELPPLTTLAPHFLDALLERQAIQ